MNMRFRNRAEAGEILAERLVHYENNPNVIVLGLPRGGVPVAARVARRLGAPLDVFIVRKLGLPGHPELAMGAIASGGVRVFNGALVNSMRIPAEVIDDVSATEFYELQRRERAYREGRPAPEVEGKIVIVVDDGIATGSTMAAAVSALRQLNVAKIVIAAPVISPFTRGYLRKFADEIVAVLAPHEFYGVGQFYEEFGQTSDEEVRALLAQERQPEEATA